MPRRDSRGALFSGCRVAGGGVCSLPGRESEAFDGGETAGSDERRTDKSGNAPEEDGLVVCRDRPGSTDGSGEARIGSGSSC